MNKLSLNAFSLKLIAIIAMGVQHTTRVLWEYLPLNLVYSLYIFRGLTFPIMGFFLVEGFKRTTNVKKYILRLVIFAAIAQVPYTLAFGFYQLNIIFSLTLGLVLLVLHKKLYVEEQKKGQFVLAFIILLIGASIIFEGSLFVPLMVFLIYIIKDEKKRIIFPILGMAIFEFMNTLILYILPAEMLIAISEVAQLEVMLMQHFFVFSIGAFLAIPLLLMYNGERGKRAKYLFYAFYPGHLFILFLISNALSA